MQAKLPCVAPVETQPAKLAGGGVGAGVDGAGAPVPVPVGTGAVTNGLEPLQAARITAAAIAPSVFTNDGEMSARIDHHQAAGDVEQFLVDIA